MNSILFIVMACMMTAVIGLSERFDLSDQDYKLCGKLYTPFVKKVCNDHIDKIVGLGSIDKHEELFNKCCSTGCSSLQIAIGFCPGQRDNITKSIFIPPSITASPPKTTTSNGPLKYIKNEWHVINKSVFRFIFGGIYE